MRESQLNKQAQDLIAKHGGYVIKTIVTNKAGTADILACVNGRFMALEGKVNGNVASALQLEAIRAVIMAGGLAKVLLSESDVLELIGLAMRHEQQALPEAKVKVLTL